MNEEEKAIIGFLARCVAELGIRSQVLGVDELRRLFTIADEYEPEESN